ncbi:MAG: threonine/serine exporter family protein [Planctomycetes bacterium]|nr:threonine/serine exporter family protein [Planctomycetota bacterium]
MTDFLKAFQDTAGRLPPMVLFFAGLVMIWQGLCLWLGGLRWLKFFAGAVAAGIGYAIAYYFTDRQLYFLIGGAVLAGLLAILFEKTTVILLLAMLMSLVVCLLLAWPTLTNPQTWQNPPVMNISPSPQAEQNVSQSLTVLEEYAQWAGQKVYEAIKSLGKTSWAAAAVAALVIIGVGIAFPRGLCALTCSIIGMVFVSVGMFFMLLYKGSLPADIVLENPILFEGIAAVMIVFGVLVNLAIAPAKKHKQTKSAEAE